MNSNKKEINKNTSEMNDVQIRKDENNKPIMIVENDDMSNIN